MSDLGWVTMPTEEFEALHWEIRNGTASLQSLQRGYNTLYAEAKRSELEAEALIAFLRIQVSRLQDALDASHQHPAEYPKPGCKACEILNAP